MTGPQVWTVDGAWLDLHCGLGEEPYYEAASNSLRFVDLRKKQLHSVSLDAGAASLKTTQLDTCPSVTADICGVDPGDRILLGIKHGVAVLDRRSGQYEMVSRFSEPDNERLRVNDGAADPQGRFWLGSMTDFGLGEVQPEGEGSTKRLLPLQGRVGCQRLTGDDERAGRVARLLRRLRGAGGGAHGPPHPQLGGLVAGPAHHVLYALEDAGDLGVGLGRGRGRAHLGQAPLLPARHGGRHRRRGQHVERRVRRGARHQD